MADENTPKDQRTSNASIAATLDEIDPKVHRRLLGFINEARTPADLLVAPANRAVVNEEEEHLDFEEQEPDETPMMTLEAAQALIRARDRVSPNQGFAHLKQAVDLVPGVAQLLPALLACFGPAKYGRWDLLYPLNPGGRPMAIEHAALMKTYKVVFLADGTDTAVWDPASEVTPLLSRLSSADTGLAANIVCCGHSFLSDGRLLSVGGGGLGSGNPTSIQGWKFDPETEKWNRTAGDMSQQRWYPTAMTMADEGAAGNTGRVLIGGGGDGAPFLEMYSEATDTFSSVTVEAPPEHNFFQRYPSLHLLPGGEVFYVPTGFGGCDTGAVAFLDDPSSVFTFDGALSGSWTDVDGPRNRTKGMSALVLDSAYPFVRAFVAGGGGASRSTVQLANLSGPTPSWGPEISFPDGRFRVNVNVVLLPDGSVFVVGGLQAPPLTCYRFDPTTPSPWAEMAELNRPRHYHSCALLLPSGKVMAAGGAPPAGCSASTENTIEVFSPPYLFNADGSPATRPVIKSIDDVAPKPGEIPTINHGSSFYIETPDAGYIAKVVLVRPMACTHNTDTEQRVIQCKFARTEEYTLCADAPNGLPPAIAPRGYYLLFIINSAGVPSEGKFVHLF